MIRRSSGRKLNKFRVLFKIKPKHGLIYKYMIDHDLSLKEMSFITGIGKATLLKILHFKWIPNKNRYNSAKTISKLEKFFNESIDSIIPPALAGHISSSKEIRKLFQETHIVEKIVDVNCISLEEIKQIGYTQEYDKLFILNKITDLLKTLHPREEKVINMHFGLCGEEEQTLKEIGEKFNVTTKCARQILAKGLCKLRGPARRNRLEEII